MKRAAIVIAGAALLAVGCDAGSVDRLPAFNTSGAESAVASRLLSLRGIVATHPDSAQAWGLLALSLQAHGYPDAALDAYAAARLLKSDAFAFHYLPATMLAERGDAGAGELFRSARSIRPDYVPLRLREAAWELDQGRPDRVEALVDDSVVSAATAQAKLILARARLALDDVEGAQQLLEEAVTVAPGYGELHGQLAEVYRRLGRIEAAEAATLRAGSLRGAPSVDDPVMATLYAEGVSSRWHILRGQSYLAAGQAEEARRSFEAAVDARPDDAHTWNQLGVALQALGQFGPASDAHRKALELRPGFVDAAINLGSSLFLGGDQRAGLEAAVLALEMDSTHAQAYLNIGMFQQAMGRSDQARAAYLAGLAKAPFDQRIALRLAWILATDRSAALRDGRRSVVLAETVNEMEAYQSAASLDVLAAAYAEYGAFDRAIAASRQAVLIASQAGNSDLADAISSRVELYVSGRPYRE